MKLKPTSKNSENKNLHLSLYEMIKINCMSGNLSLCVDLDPRENSFQFYLRANCEISFFQVGSLEEHQTLSLWQIFFCWLCVRGVFLCLL